MPTVYRDKKSKFYQADIWIEGRKFSRSTKCTSKREAGIAAELIEKDLRAELEGQGTVLTSLRLDYVAERWMRDVGDHHRGDGPTINEYKIDRLLEFFGPDKLLADVTHDDALRLVNWRRRHTIDQRRKKKPQAGKTKPSRLISPYTVNDTTEQLKKLFTYCKARQRQVKFKSEKFPAKTVQRSVVLRLTSS